MRKIVRNKVSDTKKQVCDLLFAREKLLVVIMDSPLLLIGEHKMILFRLFTVTLCFVMLSGSAYSMQKGFGAGLIIGEPTGFVIKKWIDQNAAIDGAVAWSFDGEDSLHLHGDYLLHNYTLLQKQQGQVKGQLPVYYGLGARIKFKDDKKGDDVQVGIRVPIGVSYILNPHPIDFFVEIVPVMDVAPDTDLDLNAAIGVRYFFN